MQFPINLNLNGRPCLVVGAGPIALRKTEQLLACGADVTVLAPEIHQRFNNLPVRIVQRSYEADDVVGYRLVITATANRNVDQQIYDEAEAHGIWVNSADDPDRCAFTLPAVVRRGSLMLTVSTGGASPGLSSWLRQRLEQEFGEGWADVVSDLALERAQLHAAGQSTEGLDWVPSIERAITNRIPNEGVSVR